MRRRPSRLRATIRAQPISPVRRGSSNGNGSAKPLGRSFYRKFLRRLREVGELHPDALQMMQQVVECLPRIMLVATPADVNVVRRRRSVVRTDHDAYDPLTGRYVLAVVRDSDADSEAELPLAAVRRQHDRRWLKNAGLRRRSVPPIDLLDLELAIGIALGRIQRPEVEGRLTARFR
jgi:hypothetical protein